MEPISPFPFINIFAMKHMPRITPTVFAWLLCLVVPWAAQAQQPTIDGTIDTGAYQQLAEWTQSNTGFGDHGILELWAERDDDMLYVFLMGEAESNGNELYLFVDINSQDGVAAGSSLPAGSDGPSPFSALQMTNDFETDYGLRLSSSTSESFVSIIDYVSWQTGTAEDTFLGSLANDGTPLTVNSGAYDGAMFAYNDTGSLSGHTGVEGWEVAIPLSAIGAAPGDDFRLFALYGNDDFISANTLPEIAGQSGTNLASNPDFTAIAGDQHTAPNPLPVEMTAFEATLDGAAAHLQWRTGSETNNAGFEVQHAAPNQDFEPQGFVEGRGTTDTPQQYTFRIGNLVPGTHRFRLQQTDLDGTTTLTDVRTVEVTMRNRVMIQATPNPLRGTGTVRFAVQQAQPVTVTVYNVLGQHVKTLYTGTPVPDQAETITFDTGTLASGTYFVRIAGDTVQKTRRVAVVR